MLQATLNPSNQLNRWGISGGLEPQRADLFYVDFKTAVAGVNGAFANAAFKKLSPVPPQCVKSLTLPELRTKPEAVRRDSIPYQMPSWDDPLDPVKITFMLDSENSPVTALLDAWLALSRAGRGSRTGGYVNSNGYITLNAQYSVDFRFDIGVNLLRGSATGKPDLSALVTGSSYTLKNAWLGGYRLTDLSMTESVLVAVDAVFYADDVLLGGVPLANITGAAA